MMPLPSIGMVSRRAAPALAWELSATVRAGDEATDLVVETRSDQPIRSCSDEWRFEGFFFD